MPRRGVAGGVGAAIVELCEALGVVTPLGEGSLLRQAPSAEHTQRAASLARPRPLVTGRPGTRSVLALALLSEPELLHLQL